jgi:hypothetical protein
MEWVRGETIFQTEFSNSRLDSGQTYLHSFYDTLLADTHKNNGNISLSNKIFQRTINWCSQSGELAFTHFIEQCSKNN